MIYERFEKLEEDTSTLENILQSIKDEIPELLKSVITNHFEELEFTQKDEWCVEDEEITKIIDTIYEYFMSSIQQNIKNKIDKSNIRVIDDDTTITDNIEFNKNLITDVFKIIVENNRVLFMHDKNKMIELLDNKVLHNIIYTILKNVIFNYKICRDEERISTINCIINLFKWI